MSEGLGRSGGGACCSIARALVFQRWSSFPLTDAHPHAEPGHCRRYSGKGKFDVGDGDQVILLGYAGDETGKTKVRSLFVGLDAGGETAILYELKFGEVVTTFRRSRTSGFGVETVEYKNLSPTARGVEDHVKAADAPHGCACLCQGRYILHGNSLEQGVDGREHEGLRVLCCWLTRRYCCHWRHRPGSSIRCWTWSS